MTEEEINNKVNEYHKRLKPIMEDVMKDFPHNDDIRIKVLWRLTTPPLNYLLATGETIFCDSNSHTVDDFKDAILTKLSKFVEEGVDEFASLRIKKTIKH